MSRYLKDIVGVNSMLLALFLCAYFVSCASQGQAREELLTPAVIANAVRQKITEPNEALLEHSWLSTQVGDELKDAGWERVTPIRNDIRVYLGWEIRRDKGKLTMLKTYYANSPEPSLVEIQLSFNGSGQLVVNRIQVQRDTILKGRMP